MADHVLMPRAPLLARLARCAIAARALRAALKVNDQDRVRAALDALGEAEHSDVLAWSEELRARGFVGEGFLS